MGTSKTQFNLRRIEMGDEDTESSEEEALSDVDESNMTNKKVIILGAGVAGISAALFLKKHDVEAVVLEGRDRIGGRIFTDYHSFSAPVDLGAFIITGADPDVSRNSACDPCGPISRALGLGLHYLDSRTLPLYHEVYEGNPIPQDIDTQSTLLFDRILDGIAERQSDTDDPEMNLSEGISLGGLFGQCLKEYIDKIELPNQQPSHEASKEQIVGSVIQSRAIPTETEMDEIPKGLTSSGQKQKRPTEVPESGASEPPVKREGDVNPIRKKLKITVKGQKDVVVDVYPKSHPPAGCPDRPVKGIKTMSLAQLCPPDKTRALEGRMLPAGKTDSRSAVQKTEKLSLAELQKISSKTKTARRGRGRPPKIPPALSKLRAENGHGVKQPIHLALSDPNAKVDVVMWHKAHLEYGCGTSLNNLSAVHWNQDEDYGGFNGRHAIVKGGMAPLVERLSIGLDIRLEMVATEVEYGSDGVRVTCQNGDVFEGGCVICTLPLGVLKASSVKFSPPLPPWKKDAIESIGYGNLNKIVLEFRSVFWNASVDYFGIVPKPTPTSQSDVESQYDEAGFCFMWCTGFRYTSKPLLTGIVSGNMADKVEQLSDEVVIQMALENLSSVFGDCVASLFLHGKMTRWKSDVFSRGCYTYIPAGMSGRGYENLSHPILGHGFGVLFGGEHTNKQHPDTIGGAMITGVREGKRALHLLYGPDASKRKVQVPSVQRARDQDASELLFKEAEAEIVRSHKI